MKIVKRLLLVVLILIVLLVGTAVAIPYFYKDELLELTKTEINKNINAKVDFNDLTLSVFKSFPSLTLGLEGFFVEGIDQFEGVRLAGAESLNLNLNLLSVMNVGEKPLKINSIHLEKPEINVMVLKDGSANYDIAKPTDERITEEAESTDYSGLEINLRNYSITDGNIIFDDKQGDIYLKIVDLDHSGSGNFTLDVFDLDTETSIAGITARQGAVTYLNKAQTSLDAIFNIDQKNSKYTLKDNTLRVNALQLQADGFVQLQEDDINLDLKVDAPGNNFKDLLSLIPNAFIKGYEAVKANGTFNLHADAKGTYNATTSELPAFNVDLKVDNANVKYPDLPLGIDNINTQLAIQSPSSNLNDMKIDVDRFTVKIGNNPFEAQFKLRTPISDPQLNAVANGKINLEELSKAFPMEGVDQLNGLITSNLKINTRMSYIDQQAYDKVDMQGKLQIQNMNYQAAQTPAVQIKNMAMDFSPQYVKLDDFSAQLGKSDIQANGTIDNILAYFTPEKTLTGKLQVRSNLFDANEWVPAETTTTTQPKPQTVANDSAPAEETEVFDRFDFTLDAEINEIRYDQYNLKNAVAKGHFTPQKLTVSSLGTEIGHSDFMASGEILNVFDFLFDGGTLGGNINLNSRMIDLNQFMTTDETAANQTEVPSTPPSSSEGMEPIKVPDNIDMKINADVGEVRYTNMVLKNVDGELTIADEAVVLNGVKANTLGGDVEISGGYDTKDKELPAYNFKYDIQRLNFQQTYGALNTFQQLAPFGKFINGDFTSTLILDGRLGKDMMPDLSTLNAEGFLQTIDGVIKNFKPLEKIGNLLNVDYLSDNIKLENTKNWFTIKDGAVVIEEFTRKVKDIDFKIAGRHTIDQIIDYTVKAKVPRKLLESNNITGLATDGLDKIREEANKLGLDLKKSEFVNIQFNLTGPLTDPKVGTKLLGGSGEASVKDAVKEEVKDKIAEGKEKVKEEVDKAVDSAKTVAADKIKEAAEDAKDKLIDKIKTDSTTKKVIDDVVGEKGKEAADEIKEKLKKWNPFKKKKDN